MPVHPAVELLDEPKMVQEDKKPASFSDAGLIQFFGRARLVIRASRTHHIPSHNRQPHNRMCRR